MAIVTFYNCDPKDAPKTTMPAHLGANGIFTCKGKLLLEKRRDSDIWGMVGGGCKKTETGRDAIAREVYEDEEIQAIPKNLVSINPGDELVFLCDYYSYEGNYQASYQLGEALTATENMEISNTDVGSGRVRVSYRFTDIYQQHYWTPTIDG